jgi:hypothetical protein
MQCHKIAVLTNFAPMVAQQLANLGKVPSNRFLQECRYTSMPSKLLGVRITCNPDKLGLLRLVECYM